jgi:DNA-binding transcriptional ArsR family regulator
MTDYEPDQTTLGLLGGEHQNGTWVGRELLPIANRIRNQGGSEDDYRRWVLSSHLWSSYIYSTGDWVHKQESSLKSAWRKSNDSEVFDLEISLTDLRGRIRNHTGWTGRTGSRDRAVALALVEFCIDHHCYTRTLSSYELAKWTAGMSQQSVSRALLALADNGLVKELLRTDKRTSKYSTKRYDINLRWAAGSRQGGVSTTGLRNTDKLSLSQELPPPSDLWSRKGLGPGAQRVHEVLSDEPVKVRHIADRTGMKPPSVKRYLRMLSDNCLAGSKPGSPGEPTLYFRVDTPLDVVADSLGIYGHVEIKRWEIEQRQHANRVANPKAYRRISAN